MGSGASFMGCRNLCENSLQQHAPAERQRSYLSLLRSLVLIASTREILRYQSTDKRIVDIKVVLVMMLLLLHVKITC